MEASRDRSSDSALVVYGLINFDSFDRIRSKAELIHAQDPSQFPSLQATAEFFGSLKPENRKGMAEMALIFNSLLKARVEKLSRDLNSDRLGLWYSEALAEMEFSGPDDLSKEDAWHPSLKGKEKISAALWRGAEPALEFLGVSTRGQIKELK